jgi:hypothetical protein
MHRRRIDDGIRLKGSSEAEIVAQIRNPEHGMMPGWNERPREPTFKHMAVYVRTLGGGQVGTSQSRQTKDQATNPPDGNTAVFHVGVSGQATIADCRVELEGSATDGVDNGT